jgi:hypothetical protein
LSNREGFTTTSTSSRTKPANQSEDGYLAELGTRSRSYEEQACHKKQDIRINQKNKLLSKQQVITAQDHAHHLGVKHTGLHSREATHGITTLLIKQGLIIINFGHHLEV